MKHNDLANAVMPRYVVVWENALGYLPDDARPQWRKLASRGDWPGAAGLFVLDHQMLNQVTRLAFHYGMPFDVVTYCGPPRLALALSDILDHHNVPVKRVYASTPELMARSTSYDPAIIGVYDANPGHALVYGKKGTVLTHFSQLGG